ncbi:hypothetical protein EC991_002317 [Linnemannia zychae]|nr:hypothetical protein EC991_002317 [Linnemannia zychae]
MAWTKFFSECVVLFVYFLTPAGYVLAANYSLSNGAKDFLFSVLAHLEGPLPRGLVTACEASIIIHTLVAILLIKGTVLAIIENLACGLLCIAATLYYYAMFEEFDCSHRLSVRLILYVITHQLDPTAHIVEAQGDPLLQSQLASPPLVLNETLEKDTRRYLGK